MSDCVVYIDEAGDLGYQRGTRWFVLTAVIVDKANEPSIRANILRIKQRLNVKEIHLRKINDFYRRAYLVRELNEEKFTYINIIADTNKLNLSTASSPDVSYNYICRMLLERVSWYLRDHHNTADVVLSARGTSRDGELIKYIKEKLLPYQENKISKTVFENITAKTAGSWDLLQLADVCATTMFLAYEQNGWGFCTPCFSAVLSGHLYRHGGKTLSYGIKYYSADMAEPRESMQRNWCCKEKEKTPGTTTT